MPGTADQYMSWFRGAGLFILRDPTFSLWDVTIKRIDNCKTYCTLGDVIRKLNSAELYPGKKLGLLTVVRPSAQKHYVICRCVCGALITAYKSNLKLGKTKSCGSHRQASKSVQVSLRKGDSAHVLYSRWRGMINRCYNSNQPHYARYGGRGIKVCARWHTFRNFARDLGMPPKGCSLDRIDSDGDYSPENCRWATATEQARNTRLPCNARLLTFNGTTRTLSLWARYLGIQVGTLAKRIDAGWSVPKALTISVGLSGPKSSKVKPVH